MFFVIKGSGRLDGFYMDITLVFSWIGSVFLSFIGSSGFSWIGFLGSSMIEVVVSKEAGFGY